MKLNIAVIVTVIIYSHCIDSKLATSTSRTKAKGTVNRNTSLGSNGVALTSVTKPPILAASITTTRRPILSGLRFPCSCEEGDCGCCTGYILDRFNQKGCINVSYDPDDFSISAAMSMNGKVLYKNSISGKNPPPMCVRIPRVQFIKFCVQFSNVYFASRNVHMCIDAKAEWQDFTLLEWSFECIRMGTSGFAVVHPEDGGGLPSGSIDAVDQTDEDYDDSARNVLPAKQGPKLIFHDSLKKLSHGKPNKNLIKVKQLRNNSYLISYGTAARN